MRRVAVKSSNITHVKYKPNSMALKVWFKKGGVYEYTPITEEAYHMLLKADSVGKYFAECIKNTDTIDCQKIK